MSTFSRRGPGQSYLKRILAEHVQRVMSLETELEINPMKIYEDMVAKEQIDKGLSSEEVIGHPLVQEHIKNHSEVLLELCQTLLSEIFASVDYVPYGIRWICKQIRGLALRRDPTVTDSVSCSLIGTFFFLRFVNPAIVAPEANLITPSAPNTHMRRTLVLTAKLIQQLVNNPTFVKEAYMDPLKPAIEKHRAGMIHFLHTLCNVPDFYDTLEMDQYMTLSKRDTKLRISVNELYFMHGLVFKHLDVLAPDSESPLRQLLKLLGPAPKMLPRKASYNIDLPLYSKWETSISDLNSTLITENNMTPSDILYMETKSALVKLLQRLPEEMKVRPINLASLVQKGMEHERKEVKELSSRVSRMLRELEETRVIRDQAQQALLVEEVTLEFEYKGAPKDKLFDEMSCLQSVHSTLEQRNTYLRGQLDTYKSYLQNVRCATGSVHPKGDNKLLPFVQVENRDRKTTRPHGTTPTHKFGLEQFSRDGILLQCHIPEDRRQQIFFSIISPMPGSFLIGLHFKGRAEPLVEVDVKLDDLLEKQSDRDQVLDMEYVKLNVCRLYALLCSLYGLTRRR
ncbi:RasGAP protein [Malassezia nana]|uniref:RasGAP protein n=1 Tax=Malassezia nana TaxID=180528 RepID=A0AAF0EP12_9BASI|nr:RasGAP protein [Malassezia nana]